MLSQGWYSFKSKVFTRLWPGSGSLVTKQQTCHKVATTMLQPNGISVCISNLRH